MATAFSHALSAATFGSLFPRSQVPRRYWFAGIACSILPDLDAVGYWYGIPYDHLLGHRGLTHSLSFALATALLATWVIKALSRTEVASLPLALYLFLCTASHGILDAMTNGGLGIAFLSPFSNERFFLPFRPVQVSPIGIRAFFSEWGVSVILSEFLWIWMPCLLVLLVSLGVHRRREDGRVR